MSTQFEWVSDLLVHIEDSLRKEDFKMVGIVRLHSGRIINLDNVTRMYKGEDEFFNGCIIIEFVGGDHTCIYPSDDKTYSQLEGWMKSVPLLTTFEA